MSSPLPTDRNRQSSCRLLRVEGIAVRGWFVLASALLLGCGQEAPVATVEGKLRINGQPLDNCLISFLPESGQNEPGPHSTGVTDDRGYYRLRLPDQQEGASVGRHRVTVVDLSVCTGVHRRDHGAVDRETNQTTPPTVRRSRVPTRYSSPADTPLRRDTRPGPQTIDLDIK